MPTENVLLQFNTMAGMAGINELNAGLLKLNAASLGLVAGLAILYKVGSDGVANYKAQEEAVKQLEQAYRSQGLTYEANRAALEAFIQTNAKFISNQYDVMAAMAGLIRAGNSEADALRILNDALDLAAIKHEDVSEASRMLTLVLAGNSRALRELGITADQYNAIMKDKLLTTEEKHLALLTLIESKTAQGRLTTDQYTQSQNELNKSWQDFTGQTGGPLVGMLTKINEALSTGIQLMELYNKLVLAITGEGGVIQRTINQNQKNTTGAGPGKSRQPSGLGLLSGGSGSGVSGGSESAPAGSFDSPFDPNAKLDPSQVEDRRGGHLAGGAVGGSGAGGLLLAPTINFNVGGLVTDGPALDRLTTEIVRRMRYATGL